MQINRFAIHTWIGVLLASLVLSSPARAEKTAALVVHENPRMLKLPQFYDQQMKPYSQRPLKGQLTVVHLWATWCIPCLKELPQLDKFAAGYTDDQVLFVAIALDKELEKVQGFYTQHSITHLPLYIDPTVKIFRKIDVFDLPATLFMNANGWEIARIEGLANWESDSLRDFVTRNLPD